MTNLTVGELRQAIIDLPDDMVVAISYEGVYQTCTVEVDELVGDYFANPRPMHRCLVLVDAEHYPFDVYRLGQSTGA